MFFISPPMFLSVVIPAYNEAVIIERTIDTIVAYFAKKNFEFEVIVVDDGSTDETAARAHEASQRIPNVRVIRLSKNQGKGGAVKAGALASRGEWMLFLDADLSTQPMEFEKFVPYLATHDIVIGSRCLPGSVITVHQPWSREILGRLLNKLFRVVSHVPFADTQCGFKLFHQRTKSLFQEQVLTRWLFEVEVLYMAIKQNFRIQEIPISWAHDRHSSVKLSDGLRILYDLWTIRRIH